MRLRLLLVTFALLLAACVAPPVAPGGYVTPWIGELGFVNQDIARTQAALETTRIYNDRQIVLATQYAQATANAYAFQQQQTADAQAAAEAAHELSVTQTAEVVYFGMTQAAITSTADAQQAAATVTARAATGTAQALAPTATYLAAVAAIQQTEMPRRATAEAEIAVVREAGAMLGANLRSLILNGLFFAGSVGLVAAAYMLFQLMLARNRLVMVGNVPMYIGTGGPQIIDAPPLRAIAAPAPEEWEEEPEQLVKFSSRGQSYYAPIREKINPEKALILRLLRNSLEYYRTHPDWDRRRIPGSRELAWEGRDWVKATNALSGYIVKTPGEGSFLSGSFTVGRLYEMVGRSDYSPTLKSFRTLEEAM